MHLCIYKVYSEEQNTCLALVNSTCKYYHRLKNDRNGHLHLFPSLLSTWHPLYSTKMAVNRLNQFQRPVQAQIQHLQEGNMDTISLAPLKNLCQRKMHSRTLAEKLHILNVMQKKRWTQPQTAKHFNTIKGYKGSTIFRVGRGRKGIGGRMLGMGILMELPGESEQ